MGCFFVNPQSDRSSSMGESVPNGESDLELYQTKFDPKTYLGYCYQFAETSGQKDNSRFVTFVLCQLSKTFSTGNSSVVSQTNRLLYKTMKQQTKYNGSMCKKPCE